MKMPEELKKCDLEQQFEARMRDLLGRIPFLRSGPVMRDAKLSAASHVRPDYLAKITAGDRSWMLVVECKRLGQPREVRTAALQLTAYLEHLPGNTRGYGLVLAPFISDDSARICAEAGVGYADLAGNARLSFDQVFIETRVADNPFREKRETRSIFAPRAARVLRVLLQGPLRPWKVAELAATAEVSLGWVSAVRQQLLAREWAVQEQGGLRVAQPSAVLEAWSKADDWGKRTRTHEYSVLYPDPVELAARVRDLLAREAPIFTQWIAGWLRHPYTTPAVVTAYVKRFPDDALLREKLLARRVPNGGTLRLVAPKDEGVWNPSQTLRGFELVSDVQIYLDLAHVGLRGDEQAAELRRWPDFAGGWG
jgi:hypothetical protein